MTDFSLQFDSAPFEALDQLALLARQDYNLGGAGDWFGEFRGGLYGFYGRLHGVQIHYSEVHAWLPRVRIPKDTEYQLTTILFQMDSALECLTFALNALGWAAHPSGFFDVTEARTPPSGRVRPGARTALNYGLPRRGRRLTRGRGGRARSPLARSGACP